MNDVILTVSCTAPFVILAIISRYLLERIPETELEFDK